MVALLMVACKQHEKIQLQALNDLSKEAIRLEVISTLNDYFADIKAGGLTAGSAYLDNSHEFFWVPPGFNSPISYDSVIAIHHAKSGTFSQMVFEWDTLQVFPINHQFANYTGIVNGKMTNNIGKITKVVMIETGTMVKRANKWKFLNGQSAVLGNDKPFLAD